MTELTDRMRTCAAHIQSRKEAGDPWAVEMIAIHAAALLMEASDQIELLNGPVDLGEPMQIIEQPKQQPKQHPQHHQPLASAAVWIDEHSTLPPPGPKSRNACPNCDSRVAKTIHRQGGHFVLECPVCGHAWKRQ